MHEIIIIIMMVTNCLTLGWQSDSSVLHSSSIPSRSIDYLQCSSVDRLPPTYSSSGHFSLQSSFSWLLFTCGALSPPYSSQFHYPPAVSPWDYQPHSSSSQYLVFLPILSIGCQATWLVSLWVSTVKYMFLSSTDCSFLLSIIFPTTWSVLCTGSLYLNTDQLS